ncbi:DNA polymerase III gamma and tau subunits (plasmid) [Anabaenopsis circularis NIES-21]|uniref:DNA polymerase III gamma and tau subunits n=1 Tax=Anabaenopsis circularis NIES-21 TaxID=1085406 RepID=A0A1Z4GRM5_9CYAN|nr:DNA polymerase III gamma and tau subunits [Anabaenopsis circularis NIES-21]
MNRLTLSKLKKIAAQKGYEVQFERGVYKLFKQVADFDSLSEAEEFLIQETSVPTPPPPPPPPTLQLLKPHQPPPPAPKFDLAAIWERVLHEISEIPLRALIGQMCSLVSFDGQSAFTQCKSAWYDKISTKLPTLAIAFESILGRNINLTLLKAAQLPTKSPSPAITAAFVPPSPIPPLPQILKTPPDTNYLPLLSSGKYRILVVDEIIAQGYPQLDGKKYLDVLKTVSLAKILDFYQLSIGMKLSISVPFNRGECWLLNFEVISLAIQSLKDGNYVYVVLQPISRLTAADHYLLIQTEDIF